MAQTIQQPITVSQVNNAPQGLRWNRDAAQKAANKGLFLKVGGKTVTKRPITVSGTRRSWSSASPAENGIVFVTDYRITGTPDDIRTALRYAGVTEEEITRSLGNAITKQNFDTSHAELFATEVERYKENKGVAKDKVKSYDFEMIKYIANKVKDKDVVVFSKEGGTVASENESTGNVGGKGATLVEKYQKLVEGKVIDVSTMDLVTSKGSKMVSEQKLGKGGKYGDGTLPIISNDLQKYVKALEFLYGPTASNTYSVQIASVNSKLSHAQQAQQAQQVQKAVNVVPPTVQIPHPHVTTLPVQFPGTNLVPVPLLQPANSHQKVHTGVPLVSSPKLQTVGGKGLANIPPLKA